MMTTNDAPWIERPKETGITDESIMSVLKAHPNRRYNCADVLEELHIEHTKSNMKRVRGKLSSLARFRIIEKDTGRDERNICCYTFYYKSD